MKLLPLFSLMAFAACLPGCGSDADPNQVATEFWQASKDGDFETAKSLVTQDSRKKMDEPEDNKRSMIQEFTLSAATVDGDTAECKTQLKSNGSDFNITTRLVREDGAWKVDMIATRANLGDAFLDAMKEGFKSIQGEMMDAASGLPDEVIESMKNSIKAGG